jgi:hypothetical protein
MRRKTAATGAATDLRLITSKPQPDTLDKESAALSSLLELGMSYKRQLCRDSVGDERATETVRFKVILPGSDNPLGEHIARKRLREFLEGRLGSPLSEAIGDGERLASALFEAEDERLIQIKHVK